MSYNYKVLECAVCYAEDGRELRKCEYCKMPMCIGCTALIFCGSDFVSFCNDCIEQAHFFADNHYNHYLYKCERDSKAPLKFIDWMNQPKQEDLKTIYIEHYRLYPSEENKEIY